MASTSVWTVKVNPDLCFLLISAKICQADLYLLPPVESIVFNFCDLRLVDGNIVWLPINDEEAKVLLYPGKLVAQKVGFRHEVSHRFVLIGALLFCYDCDSTVETSRVVADQISLQTLVWLCSQ